MRLVFFGSAAFAAPAFTALIDAGHQMLALVTQPDRPKGRGRSMAPPPLKPIASVASVPILQPQTLRDRAAVLSLSRLAPEAQVVVAYGKLLPRPVLEIPPLGTVNLHGSLLPRYRGAAPIQWAVASGEAQTGVTTMLVDEGLDTGPILMARATPIGLEETAPELGERLAHLGAELLVETLERLAAGTLQPVAQDHAGASHAPALRSEDARVDWSSPATAIAARIRAFVPWPGSVTERDGLRLKLLRARPEAPGVGAPGEVVAIDQDGIVVACGEGSRLRLLEVQPQDRRPMPAAAYALGAHLAAGARLG